MTWKPKHKYGARRCEFDGLKFPSLLERDSFIQLKRLQQEGVVRFFLQQVPFRLPGLKKHQVDFCVFTNENVLFIEAKGKDLPMGALKRAQCEDLADITIHVVKKASEIPAVIQEFG